jgi:large-conductance mechanosensitive channel
MDEKLIETKVVEPKLQRSLTSDIAVAVVSGAAGGAANATVAAVVNNVIKKPPKDKES